MSNVLKQSRYQRLEETFRIQSQWKRKRTVTNNDELSPATATDVNDHEAGTHMTEDAKKRAEQILQEAARKAEQLQNEAKDAIEAWWAEQREQDSRLKEEIRQKAYDEGYVQGYEHGTEQAYQEVDEQLEKAQQIVDSSYIAKEQIICEAEPFLVQLSVEIAEKVIARKIELDDSVVVDIVHRALEQCHARGQITVLVKPEHFSLVQEAREELKQYLTDENELKVMPDRSLKNDGCVIHSQRGSIDSRVEVQLDQIKQALMEVAKEGESSNDSVPYEIQAAARKLESDSR